MKGSIRLHHVDLLTPSVEDSIEFYRDGLGMRVATRLYQRDAIDVAFLRGGPASSDLFLKLTGPPYMEWMDPIYDLRGPHLDHISFLVDDLDGWYQDLRARGIEFFSEPGLFHGVRQAHFRDAADVIVEICEVADLSAFPRRTSKAKVDDQAGFCLHHVSITCNDTPRERDFYNTYLGMDTAFEHEGEGVLFLSDPELRADPARFGPMLELIGPPGLWEREEKLLDQRGPCLDHISFLVEDVDAVHSDLVSKGVRFEIEPIDYGTDRIAFFRDPNDVYVEIELPVWEERLGSWRQGQHGEPGPSTP